MHWVSRATVATASYASIRLPGVLSGRRSLIGISWASAAPWHRASHASESMLPVFAGRLLRGPNSHDPGAVVLHLTGGTSQSYKALCPHTTLRFNIATPSYLPISVALHPPAPCPHRTTPSNRSASGPSPSHGCGTASGSCPAMLGGVRQPTKSAGTWPSMLNRDTRRLVCLVHTIAACAFFFWLTRSCCRYGECPPAMHPPRLPGHRLTGPPRLYHRVCPQLLGAVTPDRKFTMQICLLADHYGSAELLFVRAILIRAPR